MNFKYTSNPNSTKAVHFQCRKWKGENTAVSHVHSSHKGLSWEVGRDERSMEGLLLQIVTGHNVGMLCATDIGRSNVSDFSQTTVECGRPCCSLLIMVDMESALDSEWLAAWLLFVSCDDRRPR